MWCQTMTGTDRKPRPHLGKFMLASGLISLFLTGQGLAEMMSFEPPGLLGLDLAAKLPVVPERMEMTADAIFVAGTHRGGAEILRLDPGDLAIVAQTPVDLAVEDLLASPQDDRLFVLGNSDQETALLIYDSKLQLITQFSTGRLLAAPTLSAASDGRLAISGLPNGKSEGIFRIVDLGDLSRPGFLDQPSLPIAARGVAQGWFLGRDNLAFLNIGDAAALLALDSASGRTISDISGPQRKDRNPEPFAVQASLPDQPCRMGDTPTFLISDSVRNRLTLAEYAPYFSTLNILSEVEPDLGGRSAGAGAQAQGGTEIRRPLGLLASSCDRAVVWVGSLNADTVVQYAVNPTSRSLEKVGMIALPARPVDLAVGGNGSAAFALLADGRIQRFAAPPNNGGRVIGDPKVRLLQRALTQKGYPVGEIDGFFGARTKNALDQLQNQTGIIVDPTQGFDAAIDAITDMKW